MPLAPGEVRMYVCGMTVYDYCHLGHARVLVVFDVVRRWLRASGYRVKYVRNVTDIDDKIIRRAAENGEPIEALTGRFIRYMEEDAAALGVEPPDEEPRATAYVPQMIDLIGRLEAKQLAYRSASGDVNFPVRRFPDYGKLSGKSLDELRAGERVELDAAKQDPLDFVLWKRSKPEEPKWPSPWGEGRPGWHIECSAMSSKLLGQHFDIHGGGEDLQFPHHENEIAQSEGASGGKFVNYWMHNGFVRVDEQKMSKSLGNFFTVRDILKKYDAEVVRFFILRAHYRSPLSYSDVHLDDAKASLDRLYRALEEGEADAFGTTDIDWQNPFPRRFKEAMDDDFGTPEAVAVLQELASEVFQGHKQAARTLSALGRLLGLLEFEPKARRQGRKVRVLKADAGHINLTGHPATMVIGLAKSIDELIAERTEARKRKDFAEADRIRKLLLDHGIVLEDKGGITTWRRV